jgi:hypothetical protein
MLLFVAFLTAATVVYYVNYKSKLSKKLQHALVAVCICFMLGSNLPQLASFVSAPSLDWAEVQATQSADHSTVAVTILGWIADAVVGFVK